MSIQQLVTVRQIHIGNTKVFLKLKEHKLQAINLCIYLFSVSHSVMFDSAIPWTVAHWAPLSKEFSMQEYWSGLPFLSPGDLPGPGIEPGFPELQVDSLPAELPRKPQSTKDKCSYLIF